MKAVRLYGLVITGAGGGEIGGWIAMTQFHLPASSVGGGGLLLVIVGFILLVFMDKT